MLLLRWFAARGLLVAAQGAATEAATQHVGCANHPDAQQGQEQLGAQVGVEGLRTKTVRVRVRTPAGVYEAKCLIAAPERGPATTRVSGTPAGGRAACDVLV
jgi:hypothetical protein